MMIEGGTGNGFRAAVDDDHHLETHAINEPQIAFVSEAKGLAFSWPATTADLGADVNVIWLRNDDPNRMLVVEDINIASVTQADVEVWVSTGSAVAGAAIAGVNLLRSSGRVALATCRSANTNVDAGAGSTLLMTGFTGVGPIQFPLKGALVLSYLDEVSVNIVTDVAGCNATITGYFLECDV